VRSVGDGCRRVARALKQGCALQVKLALCQLGVTADKEANIATARAAIQVWHPRSRMQPIRAAACPPLVHACNAGGGVQWGAAGCTARDVELSIQQ